MEDLINKPIKPQNVTNRYKSIVAVNLTLTILCSSFLLFFLVDYINEPVPEELNEVSGEVETFSCQYKWLNYRGQVVTISLRNDDNLYEVKKDLRDCEQYNRQIKRNSDIVMLVDSNNFILEMLFVRWSYMKIKSLQRSKSGYAEFEQRIKQNEVD